MQGQGQNPTEVFKRAVASVLAQWTLLNLAVEQGWGGRESYKKRQLLYEDLVSEFKENKSIDVEDLAEILCERLTRDFSVSVEDDSDLEVAQLLVDLHKETSHGCFDLAMKVEQQQQQHATATARSRCENASSADGECGASECSETHEALETLMASTAIVPSTADNIGTAI
ncbi:uncharacterized protein LOC34621608 [Cyclospora cayetanensis]|uniref:Uncharacterized protein LOC34621608 n=1 Tax=Cyclospora cayetanensis TaxID=88456 RepID=A0A6P6RU05_9EIME|nr:uncharacterized protein LOC34621608 [Cyclospora cayetanensis]